MFKHHSNVSFDLHREVPKLELIQAAWLVKIISTILQDVGAALVDQLLSPAM